MRETGVEWGAVLARPAGAPQAGPGHCAHCRGGHPLGPQRLQHVAHPAQQRLQGAAGRKMQGVSSDEQGSGLTGLYNRLKTLQQLRRRQGFGPRTHQGLCRAALSASRPGLSPGGRGLGLGVCPRRRATRLASSDSSTCRGMGGPGIPWHGMAWHGKQCRHNQPVYTGSHTDIRCKGDCRVACMMHPALSGLPASPSTHRDADGQRVCDAISERCMHRLAVDERVPQAQQLPALAPPDGAELEQPAGGQGAGQPVGLQEGGSRQQCVSREDSDRIRLPVKGCSAGSLPAGRQLTQCSSKAHAAAPGRAGRRCPLPR